VVAGLRVMASALGDREAGDGGLLKLQPLSREAPAATLAVARKFRRENGCIDLKGY
jgi:hypothetical protein